MSHLLLCAAPVLDEADGRGEDAVASLTGLDGTCGERAAVANALDVVEDRNSGVASKEEVAVA